MALSVLQLAPKIHSKAAVSKEIPTQLLEELARLMLPASPPAWEQGNCSLPMCWCWQLHLPAL